MKSHRQLSLKALLCYDDTMKIGIYGLGRFGQFWASKLSEYGELICYNRTKRELNDKNLTIGSQKEVLNCDTIIFCVAISSFKEVIIETTELINPDALIMDTCSVKEYPALIMEKYLKPTNKIIATHPMFGPDSAKNGLKGLPMVLSPIRVDDYSYNIWKSIFENMQLKVLKMSCAQHDKEAAYSQGVTHFVGRVLDELRLQPTELATVGYCSLMTIVEQTCNDPLQLFYDLQRYNRYAHTVRLNLKGALDKVLEILETQDQIPKELQ
ncbi:MAG: prephenate dehydrogenase/arogenate dehydrogenase family protein [Sphaerochaetaceae bacterium]